MLLTPTEYERLTIFTAAEMARKRKARGLKLNHPEAVALIADEILEGARDGRTVADLVGYGSRVIAAEECLPGVADMVPMIQVECGFPDGTKLVTVHDPIRPGPAAPDTPTPREEAPGAISPLPGDIEINAGRPKTEVTVINTGDRPIQVGSHYHFFETNRALDFDRAAAYGKRLDIGAGTAVRFEPGQSRTVRLVPFGGTQTLGGLNNLNDEARLDEAGRAAALDRARARGFKGA